MRKVIGNKPHDYEKGEDGRFHILSFGRRSLGSRAYAFEHEAKQIVIYLEEESRQCDEDDAKYSRMYRY